MTPEKVMAGMKEKNLLLTAKNEELIKLAEKKAEAKRIYNIAAAKKTLELKQDHPVTVIKDLVKGEVADLKFKWDVAEAVYNACRESIKDTRTAIDSYRSLLAWFKAEMLRTE